MCIKNHIIINNYLLALIKTWYFFAYILLKTFWVQTKTKLICSAKFFEFKSKLEESLVSANFLFYRRIWSRTASSKDMQYHAGQKNKILKNEQKFKLEFAVTLSIIFPCSSYIVIWNL